MKVQDILQEGISKVLYHFTSTINAEKICKDNEFKLTGSFGIDSEEELTHKDKVYYLSTSRHKRAGFTVSNVYNNQVVFVLNGQKLSYNYSGKAIDYWGEDFRKNDPLKFESEDRIYHNKPVIPNALKYIDSVHILMRDMNTHNDIIARANRRLLICLKRNKIPYYVYDSVDNFLLQRKDKSVTIDKQLIKGKEAENLGRFDRYSYRYNDLGAWGELYQQHDESKLSKRAKKKLYELNWGIDDAINHIRIELHNMRTRNRDMYNKFYRIYKQSGHTSLRSFVEEIKDKFDRKR